MARPNVVANPCDNAACPIWENARCASGGKAPLHAVNAAKAVEESPGGLSAAMIMGFLGIMAGLWSEKFDHMAAVTNFVIMPMTFLSGTFYLIERLPEPFRTFSKYNPIFYLIDGFRYGFIGTHEGSLGVGVAMTLGLTLATGLICFRMFATGYKIKT